MEVECKGDRDITVAKIVLHSHSPANKSTINKVALQYPSPRIVTQIHVSQQKMLQAGSDEFPFAILGPLLWSPHSLPAPFPEAPKQFCMALLPAASPPHSFSHSH